MAEGLGGRVRASPLAPVVGRWRALSSASLKITCVLVADGNSACDTPQKHAPKAHAPNAMTTADTPFCAAPTTPGSNFRGGKFSSSSL